MPTEPPPPPLDAAAFHREGWCAATDLLDAGLLSACASEAAALLQQSPTQHGFPFDREAGTALNELSLSVELLASAAQLLGIADAVRLGESLLLAPDATPAPLLDYHLAVPHPHAPEAVVATVFLSGADLEHAAGTVLFAKLEAPRKPTTALTQQIVLRAPHAGWVTADDFTRSGPVGLSDTLTPLQLCALGWPAPGHPHWNPISFAEATRRYPKHDLSAFDPGPAGGPAAAAAASAQPLLPAEMSAPPPADALGIAWQAPELAAGEGGATLSPDQVMRFQEEGCLLLDGCARRASRLPSWPICLAFLLACWLACLLSHARARAHARVGLQ